MNGVDVSSWNAGLNIANIEADFVIIKATQGNDYHNPLCRTHATQAIDSGKLIGFYHYIDGSGAKSEADYFTTFIHDWLGTAILALDWESIQNAKWGNLDYLRELTLRVIDNTGVKPLIYCSASTFPWEIAKNLDCGTWVAQYANNHTTGYQTTPWNEGTYSCAIRQYSSMGQIDGYTGALDLDKAYMTPDQWITYATPLQDQTTLNNAPMNDINTDDLVMRTFAGDFGNGQARRNALGPRYDEVQGRLNWVYRMAQKTINGDFGNGEKRKQLLGEDYDIVQWFVNQMI